MTHKHPFMIGSEWRETTHTLPVTNPYSQEVFAEVSLAGTAEIDGAQSGADNGLQAGVFTNQLDKAMRAFNQLEVGGVVLNDVPTFRVDNMPYGGVKDSGFGREGLKYSIEEMTEIKLLVMNHYLD